jgi:hypothetical protein|tara:strand:+ start:437 stop:718 length:282 start_codon:yes stop_codon:yes gene_type:complete
MNLSEKLSNAMGEECDVEYIDGSNLRIAQYEYCPCCLRVNPFMGEHCKCSECSTPYNKVMKVKMPPEGCLMIMLMGMMSELQKDFPFANVVNS